jgi:peptide deformylase
MKLVYYPDEFLSKKVNSVNIDNIDFNPVDLKNEMVEFMLSNNGIGLSANQIGLDAQLFVMGDSKENSSLLINPTVLQHTEEIVIDIEGCLSFPNIFAQVKRPKEILVEYYDENLEIKRTHLTDYSVKVFLHEWDHLQGVTFKDRVSPLVWKMANKKAKKYTKHA